MWQDVSGHKDAEAEDLNCTEYQKKKKLVLPKRKMMISSPNWKLYVGS